MDQHQSAYEALKECYSQVTAKTAKVVESNKRKYASLGLNFLTDHLPAPQLNDSIRRDLDRTLAIAAQCAEKPVPTDTKGQIDVLTAFMENARQTTKDPYLFLVLQKGAAYDRGDYANAAKWGRKALQERMKKGLDIDCSGTAQLIQDYVGAFGLDAARKDGIMGEVADAFLREIHNDESPYMKANTISIALKAGVEFSEEQSRTLLPILEQENKDLDGRLNS